MRAPLFQPAFHQALRWSESVDALTTFRMKVPVGRSGKRLALVFAAGDGPLTIQRATVLRDGAPPVPVSFDGGKPGTSLAARAQARTDPLDLVVTSGDELFVSFEVQGALAVSAIDAFPGSERRAGAHAMAETLSGSAWNRGIGLTTIEVEGAPERAMVALGDSITEGYVSGRDDYRRAWPFIAQSKLGVPIANAAVSGQGLEATLENLDREVLALSNLTDCLVLIGTNDLQSRETSWILTRMETLIGRLEPRCNIWLGTLLPKERVSVGDFETMKVRRLEVNTWIRAQTGQAGIIDFEAFTRDANDVHRFAPGLAEDGVHPSVEGQQVMGEETAKFLGPALVPSGADSTE